MKNLTPMTRAAAAQWRDLADNDNRTPDQRVRDARAALAWAATRAQNPAFAPFVFAATAQAQQTLRTFRPKAV